MSQRNQVCAEVEREADRPNGHLRRLAWRLRHRPGPNVGLTRFAAACVIAVHVGGQAFGCTACGLDPASSGKADPMRNDATYSLTVHQADAKFHQPKTPERSGSRLPGADAASEQRARSARVDDLARWWRYAAGGFGAIAVLCWLSSRKDQRFRSWLDRQDALLKEQARTVRLELLQAEAQQNERERACRIAAQELDRLSNDRPPSSRSGAGCVQCP